ncbi:MAG: hypothetical protein AAGF66_18215 [Cyanobacteria bacterium P01_H01_bin.119]
MGREKKAPAEAGALIRVHLPILSTGGGDRVPDDLAEISQLVKRFGRVASGIVSVLMVPAILGAVSNLTKVVQIVAAPTTPATLGAVSNLTKAVQIVSAPTTSAVLGAVNNLTKAIRGGGWVRRGLGLRL